MCKPVLYKAALTALRKLGGLQRGELDGHPALIDRCASLVAAVDWIVFVLRVAGHDAHVADSVCTLLIHASYGLLSRKESCQPLLTAVVPVILTMQLHKHNRDVIENALVFLRNLSSSAPLRGELRKLGVLDVVRAAKELHPLDVGVQVRVQACLEHLV